MKMIVEDGFYHADPHLGNVFYLPGNRIAFIGLLLSIWRSGGKE